MEAAHQDRIAVPADLKKSPSSGRISWFRWGLVGLVVVAFAGFYALRLHHYVSWDYLRTHLDMLQVQVRDSLPLALLVFFLVYVAVTALSLPVATVLTLV